MADEWVLYCGREKGAAMVDKLGKNSEIAQVNIDNMDSLETALRGSIILRYISCCFHVSRSFTNQVLVKGSCL